MNITVDDSAITDYFEFCQSQAADLPVADVAQLALDYVAETFREEGRGDWAPALHDYGHPLLDDTGHMRESVQADQHNDGVVIDNPVEYASFQNEAREFMYIDEGIESQIEDLLAQHFED